MLIINRDVFMISGVSAEMILAFKKFSGQKKATLKDMFKSLSVEMGGDGNSITKEQLSSYVRNAQNGTIKLNPTRLKALKKILENWDKISKDGKSITYADLQSMPMLLFNAAVGDLSESKKDKKSEDEDKSEKFDLEKYLKDALNITEDGEITKSDIESHLKTLLADTSADTPPETSNLIDSMVNILASFDNAPTVTAEA